MCKIENIITPTSVLCALNEGKNALELSTAPNTKPQSILYVITMVAY